jgi:hydroxyethylthiazole kinase-like uncharacterized protein yjeF
MTPLPAWLDPLYDAPQMRAIDRWAIEDRGVPSLDLMERAGRGLARVVGERAPAGRVVVVCGKGNNGGDGLVAARVLREEGREVDVLCVSDPAELQGDAAAQLERLPGPAPAAFVSAAAVEGAAAIVDALLGTGFEGAPRDPVASAIRAIDSAGTEVVAADVPSGVDASTGAVEGVAVHAGATATFHAAKVGLWVSPGKRHAGEVRVIDIGVPAGAPGEAGTGLIRPAVLDLVPHRGLDATKFSEGAVLVAGGSTGLTGAPSLAAEAAQRAGAGYVTVCVPEALNLVFEVRLLEAMSRPLPGEEEGRLGPAAVDPVLEACQRADALVLGPGLGRAEGSLEFAREVAARAEVPLLLDADGLNAHAGRLGELAARRAPTVLTPHAGELARLLDADSAAIAGARLEHARQAAATADAVVVLKGDDTLVAEPGGRVGVSPGGSPALATAGTGDVLSGVTGAMLAKGLDAFDAACAAVHLHTAAGRRAAGLRGADSAIARDVIDALPRERAEGR